MIQLVDCLCNNVVILNFFFTNNLPNTFYQQLSSNLQVWAIIVNIIHLSWHGMAWVSSIAERMSSFSKKSLSFIIFLLQLIHFCCLESFKSSSTLNRHIAHCNVLLNCPSKESNNNPELKGKWKLKVGQTFSELFTVSKFPLKRPLHFWGKEPSLCYIRA